MQLLFGGLVIVAAALVAGVSPDARLVSNRSSTEEARACQFCTHDHTGGIHRTNSESGVAVMGPPLNHDWDAGECTGAFHGHQICQQTALPAKFLDDLKGYAERADMDALRESAKDPLGRIALDESVGRVEVFGCGGRVLAVMWIADPKVAVSSARGL